MSSLSEKQRNAEFDANKSILGACIDASVNDKSCVVIPYFVHEAEVMRMEKQTKRLWIAVIISVICLLASNLAWLWYISLYDFADYDFEQDGYGVNIIGDRNGVITDGTALAREDENETE